MFYKTPIMSHVIRELQELSGQNLWSQQGSSTQGYNALCGKWSSLLWWEYFGMFQSVRLLRTACTTQANRHSPKESSHQTWNHTVVTCSVLLNSYQLLVWTSFSISAGLKWNLVQFNIFDVDMSFGIFHSFVLYFS